IYIAAVGPKSVEQTAEIADGWLPMFFSPYRTHVYGDALAAGFRKAGNGKGLHNFDVAPGPIVILGDDVASCLAFVKPVLALYVGGMGARGACHDRHLRASADRGAARDRRGRTLIVRLARRRAARPARRSP